MTVNGSACFYVSIVHRGSCYVACTTETGDYYANRCSRKFDIYNLGVLQPERLFCNNDSAHRCWPLKEVGPIVP